MKVIDLLNKIVNGEEVPEKIIWNEDLFEYDKGQKAYVIESIHGITKSLLEYILECDLNDEVEIIEEEDKDIEHYDMFDNYSGYSFNGTSPDLLLHLESNFVHINEELDYLIKAVNRLKKGE